MTVFRERFGSHVHILDWALHLDETSPHIHARQVFDIENRYGEIEPKQEKALEALGIPLPFPDKKPGRQNNRKITFDSMCRELLLNICEEHGLSVEREAIYGGQASREKNDFIIAAQRERIAELERRNAELTADNEAQSRLIALKEAELEDKLEKLSDVDTVLDAVSDSAYQEAVKVVAIDAIHATQEETQRVLDKGMNLAQSPETRLKPRERELVLDWLEKVSSALKKRAATILKKVIEKLRHPTMRKSMTEKIREQARPAVRKILEEHRQTIHQHTHRSPPMER